MPMCEKCWADAYMRMLSRPSKSQAEHYFDLLEERKDNPCTPRQQSGECFDADREGEQSEKGE